jgi:hypothetical protein
MKVSGLYNHYGYFETGKYGGRILKNAFKSTVYKEKYNGCLLQKKKLVLAGTACCAI